MSQKSIDFVVDSLTSDLCRSEVKKPEVKMKPRRNIKPLPKIAPVISQANIPNEINQNVNKAVETDKNDDYEVIIKLPNGKQVRMKAVEEVPNTDNKVENNTKEKLKMAINNKASQKNVFQRLQTINPAVTNILPVSTGTLIPVTLVNTAPLVQKIPIASLNTLLKPNQEFKKTVKRKSSGTKDNGRSQNGAVEVDDDCVIVDEKTEVKKKSKEDLDSRVAASRRYR